MKKSYNEQLPNEQLPNEQLPNEPLKKKLIFISTYIRKLLIMTIFQIFDIMYQITQITIEVYRPDDNIPDTPPLERHNAMSWYSGDDDDYLSDSTDDYYDSGDESGLLL